MELLIDLTKRFIRKFINAFSGLWAGIRYDNSILLQFVLAVASIIVFAIIKITFVEWMFVINAIFIVIITEFLNSSVEDLCDLLVDKYDLHVKEIKDIAAAAVLLSAIYAVIVAVIIVGRHML
ncbi:MAG: diacylglycerol kinase family protein [Erysipelothrix sp.]|nr:diacylglycerol kinase family protein [Erysipelothrix sp.]